MRLMCSFVDVRFVVALTPEYHIIESEHIEGRHAKYYTKDEHTRVPEMQICSNVTWNKLSAEDKKLIKEAAVESSIYERRIWEEKEKLYEDELVDKGIEINTLSVEERADFKRILKPLYEKYCRDYMDLIERINDK